MLGRFFIFFVLYMVVLALLVQRRVSSESVFSCVCRLEYGNTARLSRPEKRFISELSIPFSIPSIPSILSILSILSSSLSFSVSYKKKKVREKDERRMRESEREIKKRW